MRISTLAYSIKQGIKNIFRNRFFSLASIGTIAACIFLLGIFYSIVTNFTHIVEQAEDQVSVTVFFNEGITQEQIDAIGADIRAQKAVGEVTFTSAEEAWEQFKADYFAKNPELAEGFSSNPLAKSASYTVQVKDVEKQSELVAHIEGLDGVRQVNYSARTANTLSDVGRLAGYISVAIIALLLGVGIFLISNTIVVGISVRKEEINIMKYIGATDFFVRAPFVVEGLLIGLVGATIPLVAIYYLYSEIISYVMKQFSGLTNIVSFLPVGTIFQVLLPLGLGVGAGIGLVGSIMSIRKHLKV